MWDLMTSLSRTLLLTIIAMVAFAANSVLARLALIDGAAGAGGYTAIRIISGAVFMGVLMALRQGTASALWQGSWTGPLALLSYAVFFSYAYLALGAGLGAVILFFMVQMTMIDWGLYKGETLRLLQWIGLISAFAALVWLLYPAATAPPLLAVFAMILAGASWGVYSLIGRGTTDPAGATTGNFIRAAIICLPLVPIVVLTGETAPTVMGVLYALLSGIVASGIGYTIWYAALPGLSATQAGAAQLSVPAIAAAGGILFLAEPLTLRFVVASAIILGGVALATLVKKG